MINSLNSLESLQNTCAESDCVMILITYCTIIVNNNIINLHAVDIKFLSA